MIGTASARLRAGWSLYVSMQLLGAWMIRTPRARAFLSNWSIRGAISLRRSTAFRLWWQSHMSQTMIAVAFGSHVADFSTV